MAASRKGFGKGIWILKKQILVLYFGLNDSRTPFYAKIPALLSIIYLVSPIDLIPDFIPFVGYLDDLIIVPMLLNFSIRLFPQQVRETSQLKASKEARRFRIFFIVLFMVVLLILVASFFLGRVFWELITGRVR